MIEKHIRFVSPQSVRIAASRADTYAALTRFVREPQASEAGAPEILAHDGNTFLVKFTIRLPKRTIVTQEEVVLYPPAIITFRHLAGPFKMAYEVFTAVALTPHETQVTYMGQYALKHYDWPIIGWLVHRFIVLPRYNVAIAQHLERVKRIAEHEQPL